ncbi:ribosome-inactivating family protein [Oceaniglobus trochenteri]|uniref:ribosome-inactivating family protein n=1 Tax=Oceaniglobus trochenteri TaxID=2763260 RepID=UPI001D00167C|nr:ribosome-inactivating family protein [Oceaniglobus trochenteri]
MMTVSFLNAARYSETLALLRTHLTLQRAGPLEITIDAYEGEEAPLIVRMDRHTLYLDGFKSHVNETWYHFEDALPWTGAVSLNFTGRHQQLKTNQGSTLFNGAAKFKVEELKNFAGGPDDTLRIALGFLVIVISEAVRFPAVEANVKDCVAGIAEYRPAADHKTYMSNWKAKTEAGSTDVAIGYLK